ncbi:MAG: SufE family protein [Bdellovibrionales bacterium]
MRINPELIARHYSAAPVPGAVDVEPIIPAVEAVGDLRDAFAVLNDWTERYQYIIDMGQRLKTLPPELCTEEHRLRGCQSQVWLIMTYHAPRLYMHAASDALIVNGLIALMAQVYNGRTPDEILRQGPDFIGDLGLGDHLSPGRKNGLFALIEAIQTVAAHVKRQSEAA